ncbi:vacuolar protein sorting protein VPS38 [Acrasis kona]|uniref:Vacuolar protein sorting protein VPS38 n=1 Tax=Acrasis kona TaxID=1008807 RepID=A0AAW2ZPA6_9EUKA
MGFHTFRLLEKHFDGDEENLMEAMNELKNVRSMDAHGDHEIAQTETNELINQAKTEFRNLHQDVVEDIVRIINLLSEFKNTKYPLQ